MLKLMNKAKKGIIFLLSTLQIGTISGCMNDNISKEEYEEYVKLVKNKASIEEENSKLEKDNDTLEEENSKLEKSIDKITKEKEELKRIKEQLEIENRGLKEDYLSVSYPINSNEPFNIDLAIKIGMTEEEFNDDYLKEYFNEFNNYINSLENGLYYIKYNDYTKNTGVISYLVNDKCVGYIRVLKETEKAKWLYFVYYLDDVNYSRIFTIIDNKIVRTSKDSSWIYENNNYCVSYTNYSDSSHLSFYFYSMINADEKLFINLEQDNNKCSLNINNESPFIYINEDPYAEFEINEEDFQTLKNIILSYLENNQHENIMNYCSDTLLDIFKKYGKENECQKYIDILINNNVSRVLK